MVAVTGLMRTDTLHFNFFIFELAFGAMGQLFGRQEHLYF